MEAVWQLKVTSTQKFVLLAMAWFADDAGGRIYPSVARLAERCTLNRRTVQRAVRELESLGHIAVVAPATQHRPATYELTPGAAQDRSGTGPQRHTVPPGAAYSTSRGGTAPPDPSGTVRNRHPLGGETPPAPEAPPAGKTPDRYEREFTEHVRPLYPKRAGDQKWQTALSYFRAERKRGTPLDVLVAGLKRYAAYCVARGLVGTERVKQAASFFGRDRCWEAEWNAPPPEPNDRRYSRAPDVGEQRQNIPTVEETRARLAAEDEERRKQELRAQARRVQGVA